MKDIYERKSVPQQENYEMHRRPFLKKLKSISRVLPVVISLTLFSMVGCGPVNEVVAHAQSTPSHHQAMILTCMGDFLFPDQFVQRLRRMDIPRQKDLSGEITAFDNKLCSVTDTSNSPESPVEKVCYKDLGDSPYTVVGEVHSFDNVPRFVNLHLPDTLTPSEKAQRFSQFNCTPQEINYSAQSYRELIATIQDLGY